MMRRLAALKMLLHDRSTTAGSVSGVIAIIFLVGQQLAILFGLLTYMSVLVDNSGADIWVLTKNTDNVNSAGTLPTRYIDRIEGIKGIQWAEPIITSAGLLKRTDGNYQPVQIVGLKRPRLAGGPWRFYDGSINALLDSDGITVDATDFPALGNPSVSDIFEINGKEVRVAGITRGIRGFGGILVFTNIDKAREITGFQSDRCSAVMVKISQDGSMNSVIASIQQVLPDTEVVSSDRLSRLTRLYYIKNTGIGGSFGFSTVIGALVGVVIIALTMYTNVLNKQKDFAVLRALGARKWDVVLIVLYQSIFIALIGIVAGFTLLALFLFFTQDGSLPSYMPLWLPPLHGLFTILLCLGGSLIAIRKAMQVEPATAFR
jgi:putative ABC transport system permease protein